ncbi:hypothetical protein JCM14202_380 [Agrilactobacillus composti DSM 18527 = JCM 14202]|nr:hypothetical protein JCM14202_380 [Agrilactobacillus composti DSM 18527 = JCM 14202]
MLNAAILTVSDTRHLNTDKSGQFLADYLTDHDLARVQQRLVVTDDILEIQHGFTTLALTDVDSF